MELFEQMRREYAHRMGTIKGVARKFGVHRRMVGEALASALPPSAKMAAEISTVRSVYWDASSAPMPSG